MNHYTSRVLERLLEAYKNASVRLDLPAKAIPRPGQYLLANAPHASEEALPITLFPAAAPLSRDAEPGTLLAGSIPPDWEVGTPLHIRGPKGRGFQLPIDAKRLALIPFGEHPSRLLPLLALAREQAATAVLLSDQILHEIPIEVEVQPSSNLEEVAAWADVLLLDIPLNVLRSNKWESLRERLKRQSGQVLVYSDFPCGALADCGLCTLRTPHGPQLACVDGPVFTLNTLTA